MLFKVKEVKLEKFMVKFFASFFGLGYMPTAPGTWGTLGAFFAWLVFLRHLSLSNYIFVLILLVIFSTYIANLANKKYYKKHDSPHIVIDELCGYLVAMLGVSSGIYWGILGFFLFRIFDIFKPYPANIAEKLPGGIGILGDDIVAGIYVAIILNASAYFLL